MERKEAIEIVRKLYNESLFMKKDKEAMVTLIPELRESEDERIRKALLKYFGEQCDMSEFEGIYAFKIYKWLEKQGEQKPIVPEFRIGDIITPKGKKEYYTITDIVDGWYEFREKHVNGGIPIHYQFGWELVEQNPAEWSEEDEQLYDDLSDTYFYNDEDYPEDTYKFMLKRVLDWMNKRAKSLRPQKQDVMSEDEFEHVVGCLVQDIVANEHMAETEKQPTKFFVEKYYKKLRPQSTWKPSEKHFQGLRRAINKADEGSDAWRDLKDLYEQLKAL